MSFYVLACQCIIVSNKILMLLDTTRQIKSGLWAFEPNYGLALKDTVKNIFSASSQVDEKFKKEARHYLLDSNGQKLNSDSMNEVRDAVGVIHISGPMIKYGNYYCWGADELVAQARLFDANPNIVGIIFVTDTGGGAVNSVALWQDFLNTKTKPVLAWCDMCASAGYWVAVGCDYIMAANNISSSFGSIGVMATLQDASKYWEDKGIIDHIITADQSNHKNKAFELALQGKYELIRKEHLNPLAIKFQETVTSNRPNLKTDVEGIISGRMFYAEDAVAYGMADSIGNFEQAVKVLKGLSQVQQFN